jgi:hypothetical protein
MIRRVLPCLVENVLCTELVRVRMRTLMRVLIWLVRSVRKWRVRTRHSHPSSIKKDQAKEGNW